MSIKNDGHYFCRAGGNRPDGLNEPVTYESLVRAFRYFGGCVKTVLVDNQKAAVLKNNNGKVV
ncbi:hypothetical protein ACK6SO_25135, partial [Escherichia coli]